MTTRIDPLIPLHCEVAVLNAITAQGFELYSPALDPAAVAEEQDLCYQDWADPDVAHDLRYGDWAGAGTLYTLRVGNWNL